MCSTWVDSSLTLQIPEQPENSPVKNALAYFIGTSVAKKKV